MGIGDFFKKLTGAPSKEEAEESAQAQAAPAMPGRKAPMGLKLPGWAKKDNAFVRKDMGMMKPPEEMAEEASFKRPGAWLKNRLGGAADGQDLDNLEKTKVGAGSRRGPSDQELNEIFAGLLDDEGEEAGEGTPAAEKKE